jgi:dTDP-4-dehydrorhamnose reductase
MDDKKTFQNETNENILITGGYGTLGVKINEIIPNCHRPTHKEMDIQKNLMTSDYIKKINTSLIKTVIHCAALKNEQCTKNPIEAMLTNIVGTSNVVLFCKSIGAKLVYISTDYIFRGDRGRYSVSDEVGPINYYGETKLAGEYVVKSLENYLIIRLSFFPDIFPYEKAFVDQFATRITVTEAAKRIIDLTKKQETGVKHLSGIRRSVYEFALSTCKGKIIKPINLSDDPLMRPKDTSLEEN